MTALDSATEGLFDAAVCGSIDGAPVAEHYVAPRSVEQAADLMRAASDYEMSVLIWGGGTHQGLGYAVDADIVLSTHRLTDIVHWEPDDLTVVVESGVKVADLEALLAEKGQTAVLPESPGVATVGGTIASGWRRLRYGPTRDRVLETILATGDGRVVRAGGRLVKNVTGYDLPRLATGSLGSLGIIAQVCLKLWPIGARFAGVPVVDAEAAWHAAYRPLAVIETELGTMVYFAGTPEEINAQSAALGARPVDDPCWPRPLDSPWRLSVRVPIRLTSEVVARVRRLVGAQFRAAHGVGEVIVGLIDLPVAWIAETRQWAEAVGGAVVITDGDIEGHSADPWGATPGSLQLQRRVKAAFDPVGISNPGRLPGRL